jgi:hypothetical protein
MSRRRVPSKLDLDDIDIEYGPTRQSAYGKAKLMDILFTKELHKRILSPGSLIDFLA